MTVAQLIRKLQKLPQDEKVFVVNDYTFVEGDYEVTEVERYGKDYIIIGSNYKYSRGD